MTEKTKIEWADSTLNYWEGCTKVGPGCDNCYAENRNARFGGGEAPNWGPGAPRKLMSEATRKKAITWNRRPFFQCGECGWRGTRKDYDAIRKKGFLACCPEQNLEPARRRVFCASLSDWLDNEVPIEWLVDLLDLIRQTPNLDWLLLTKRIGNWELRIQSAFDTLAKGNSATAEPLLLWLARWLDGNSPSNVWLGVTAVNQPEVNRDIHKLLCTPAAIRFISVEPMLGAMDISPFLERGDSDLADDPLAAALLAGAVADGHGWVMPALDWVICGGESGPNARPMHPAWVRSLRDQCVAAGVPYLFKQWGEWIPRGGTTWDEWIMEDGSRYSGSFDTRQHLQSVLPDDSCGIERVGKKSAGRKLDGRTWDQFPEVV